MHAQGSDIKANSQTTIMVIDDEPAFLDVLSEILETKNYNVLTFSGALKALDFLQKQKPDLILTDIMMPDMDGLTLIRALRTRPEFSDLPIIVISAHAGPKDEARTLIAGANAYLAKPFTASELQNTIRTVLQNASGNAP